MSTEHAVPFLFGDDHEAFRDSVRDFAEKHWVSYLQMSARPDFPWELNRAMAAQGLLGLGVSDRLGGQGSDGQAVARIFTGIAAEELAYGNFYLSMLLFPSVMNGRTLEAFLDPSLVDQWLAPLLRGELTISFALTEPAAGSDVAGLRTQARKVDGGWQITGEKTSITSAPHAAAFITLARTPPEDGRTAVTAFLVPRSTPGLSFQRFDDAGWKPLGRGSISYDEAFVPDSHRLGPEGRAFSNVLAGFDFARVLIGLTTLGVARRALELTIAYLKEREAFGRAVSKFQGASFPVAEHATRLEAARWLCYRTLALGDAGRPHTKEASMVKWWVPRVAIDTVRDCIALNGHAAFTEELPFQALLRDISAFELADGTAQIQKTVIARALFGRDFV